VERRVDRVLVWGAGGHGRVVADAASLDPSLEVVGYADTGTKGRRRLVDNLPVISEFEVVQALAGTGGWAVAVDDLVHGVGDNRARLKIHRSFEGERFRTVIHPSAVIAKRVSIGYGSVVLATAVVNTGARVGEAVILNSGCVIEHDCAVADGAHVSPGAVLAGSVNVGECAWIGAGATVIQGVTIGTDSTVGAGAAVVEDVPPGATVVGVPAKAITRFDE